MVQTITSPGPKDSDERTLQKVVEVIKTLRYGSVEIVIHDGKVVQIERREKVRFETSAQR
ncbi:MAG: YezD family protein [Pseudomonadota bacterium]